MDNSKPVVFVAGSDILVAIFKRLDVPADYRLVTHEGFSPDAHLIKNLVVAFISCGCGQCFPLLERLRGRFPDLVIYIVCEAAACNPHEWFIRPFGVTGVLHFTGDQESLELIKRTLAGTLSPALISPP